MSGYSREQMIRIGKAKLLQFREERRQQAVQEQETAQEAGQSAALLSPVSPQEDKLHANEDGAIDDDGSDSVRAASTSDTLRTAESNPNNDTDYETDYGVDMDIEYDVAPSFSRPEPSDSGSIQLRHEFDSLMEKYIASTNEKELIQRETEALRQRLEATDASVRHLLQRISDRPIDAHAHSEAERGKFLDIDYTLFIRKLEQEFQERLFQTAREKDEYWRNEFEIFKLREDDRLLAAQGAAEDARLQSAQLGEIVRSKDAELARLHNLVQSQSAASGKGSEQITSLMNDLRNAKEHAFQKAEAAKAAEARIGELEAKIKEQDDAHLGRIAEMQSDFQTEINTRINHMTSQLVIERQKLQSLMGAIHEKEDELQSLSSSLTAENKDLRRVVGELEKENDRLSAELGRSISNAENGTSTFPLENKIAHLNHKVASLDSDKQTLLDEVAALNEMLAEAHSIMESDSNQIMRMEVVHEELLQEIHEKDLAYFSKMEESAKQAVEAQLECARLRREVEMMREEAIESQIHSKASPGYADMTPKRTINPATAVAHVAIQTEIAPVVANNKGEVLAFSENPQAACVADPKPLGCPDKISGSSDLLLGHLCAALGLSVEQLETSLSDCRTVGRLRRALSNGSTPAKKVTFADNQPDESDLLVENDVIELSEGTINGLLDESGVVNVNDGLDDCSLQTEQPSFYYDLNSFNVEEYTHNLHEKLLEYERTASIQEEEKLKAVLESAEKSVLIDELERIVEEDHRTQLEKINEMVDEINSLRFKLSQMVDEKGLIQNELHEKRIEVDLLSNQIKERIHIADSTQQSLQSIKKEYSECASQRDTLKDIVLESQRAIVALKVQKDEATAEVSRLSKFVETQKSASVNMEKSVHSDSKVIAELLDQKLAPLAERLEKIVLNDNATDMSVVAEKVCSELSSLKTQVTASQARDAQTINDLASIRQQMETTAASITECSTNLLDHIGDICEKHNLLEMGLRAEIAQMRESVINARVLDQVGPDASLFVSHIDRSPVPRRSLDDSEYRFSDSSVDLHRTARKVFAINDRVLSDLDRAIMQAESRDDQERNVGLAPLREWFSDIRMDISQSMNKILSTQEEIKSNVDAYLGKLSEVSITSAFPAVIIDGLNKLISNPVRVIVQSETSSKELEKSKDEVSKLQMTATDLRLENERLCALLTEQETAYELRVEGLLRQYEGERRDLVLKLQSLEIEKDELMALNENACLQLQKKEGDVVGQAETIRQLQATVAELSESHASKLRQIQEIQEHIGMLEQQVGYLRETEDDTTELQSRVANLEDLVQTLEGENQAVFDELEAVKSELSLAKSLADRLQHDADMAQDECDKLRLDVINACQESAAMVRQLEEKRARLRFAEDTNKRQADQLANAESLAKQYGARTEEMQAIISQYEDRTADTERILKQCEILQAEHEAEREKTTQLPAEKNELAAMVEQMRVDESRMRDMLKKAEDEAELRLSEGRRHFAEQLAAADREYRTLQEAHEHLGESLKQVTRKYRSNIELLKTEKEALKAKVEGLVRERNIARDRMEHMAGMLEERQKQAVPSGIKAVMKGLQGEVAQLRERYTQLQQRHDDLVFQKGYLGQEVSRLRKEEMQMLAVIGGERDGRDMAGKFRAVVWTVMAANRMKQAVLERQRRQYARHRLVSMGL